MAATSIPHFRITTAIFWSTSLEDQSYDQLERQKSHVLNLHCDRIVAAARAFCWVAVLHAFDGENGHKHFGTLLGRKVPSAISHSDCASSTWKVRVLVGEGAEVQVVAAPIVISPVDGIPLWPRLPDNLHSAVLSTDACKLLLDTQPTGPSKSTTHKTTARRPYDEARSRLNIEHLGPTESDVLLYNENHEVMETSLCTPYFLRDGAWITPALASGGNAGVSRRMALEAGLCVEKSLHIGELVAGEMIWLSNAVRGFIPGRLLLSGK